MPELTSRQLQGRDICIKQSSALYTPVLKNIEVDS